jgi:hypothetical protein
MARPQCDTPLVILGNRPEWTSTHQCTNVDGWCTHRHTFFVPPCPWANQGGKLKLTLFFFLSSAQVGVFLGTFFFLTPHARPGLNYLPTFRLIPMHPGLLPPPPTYLPAHLPSHLPTFPSTCLPTYLHTKSPPR